MTGRKRESEEKKEGEGIEKRERSCQVERSLEIDKLKTKVDNYVFLV